MKSIVKLICALTFILFIDPAYPNTFNKLIVVGDSLSDTGNLYQKYLYRIPKSPPYYQGRFSDELMWPEYLAAEFPGTVITNLAYGGAQTSGSHPVPGMVEQIDGYVQTNKITNKDLFAILIGANNYHSLLQQGQKISSSTIDYAIKDMAKAITTLANQGAKHIIIFDLPDLGTTPRAVHLDQANKNKTFSTNASAATRAHNIALHDEMTKLKKNFAMQNKAVKLISIDTPGFMEEVINETLIHPSSQKYFHVLPGHKANLTTECYTGDYMGKDGTICAYPHEYLYWDIVHPSSAFHKILAKFLAQVLREDYQFEMSMGINAMSVEDELAIKEINQNIMY